MSQDNQTILMDTRPPVNSTKVIDQVNSTVNNLMCAPELPPLNTPKDNKKSVRT